MTDENVKLIKGNVLWFVLSMWGLFYTSCDPARDLDVLMIFVMSAALSLFILTTNMNYVVGTMKD